MERICSMKEIVIEVLRAFLPAFFGWFFAQIPKYLICKIRKKPVTIFASGGMPSTHTSSVIAIVTRIAFVSEFRGPTFALALVFGIVTAFDACNVRYTCGQLCHKMNEVIDKAFEGKDDKPEKIKVLNGHTVAEVAVGAVVGIAVGAVYFLVEKHFFG